MSAPLPEPEVVTFGCRLNAWESEAMANRARAAGLDDVVIFNTCAVTAEAERQARQAIRKARRARPSARIVVTGCAAQISPERYAAMPEVDRVLGNREKLGDALVQADGPAVAVGDIMAAEAPAPATVDGLAGRARAHLRIQDGCDHRCTFCVIPYGRGPSRSVPLGAVVDEARRLVAGGFQEIVLTGVDLTSYGPDLPGGGSLGGLVTRLLAAVPELPRLRLSSLDPAAIDAALIRAFAEQPRLMPHAHLSLQAGDDMVLKRMRRRHSRDDVIALCETLRAARPDIAIGADMIAGFPTETEAMFANGLALVTACDLVWGHVFPYSSRPGTPAARMPQLSGDVRKQRARLLREAFAARLAAYLARRVGGTERVLAETASEGRSEGYAPVRLARPATPGSVTLTPIADHDGTVLIAA
jgi:threonylcarbamoyladenosine tRNA methylthiotransferase MtaB